MSFQKDKTIRELTDRLFYGYHKYQHQCNGAASTGLSRSTTPFSLNAWHSASAVDDMDGFSTPIDSRSTRAIVTGSAQSFSSCNDLQGSPRPTEDPPPVPVRMTKPQRSFARVSHPLYRRAWLPAIRASLSNAACSM